MYTKSYWLVHFTIKPLIMFIIYKRMLLKIYSLCIKYHVDWTSYNKLSASVLISLQVVVPLVAVCSSFIYLFIYIVWRDELSLYWLITTADATSVAQDSNLWPHVCKSRFLPLCYAHRQICSSKPFHFVKTSTFCFFVNISHINWCLALNCLD